MIQMYLCHHLIFRPQFLKEELILLSDWLKSNKLSLNLSKTTYLVFGGKKQNIKNRPALNIILDGVTISSATSMKFLSIIIDSQLNWKFHIDKLILKLNRNSAVISKIRYKIDTSIALKLYDTLINTHVSYCAGQLILILINQAKFISFK